MAVLLIACPRCDTRYKIDETSRGRQVRCKKCNGVFAAGAAPSAPAESARPHGGDGVPRDWLPGDVVLDQYDVVPLPGSEKGYAEGGMGRVNLLWHRGWMTELAVKSVRPTRSAGAREVEAFRTEAEQWVSTIGLHPHVVSCYYVRVLGGLPRVFLEYVPGGTLQEWVETGRLYEGGPRAALERVLDVAIQTARGLDYVHGLGLVHQDVKPANVLLMPDGTARVTDFGLAGARAVAFGEDDPPPGQTLLATWGGMTLAYCSPEQADAAARRKAGVPREALPKLTRRTDVWSWAATLLHLWLGEIVWAGGQLAHLGLEARIDQPRLPPLPPAVRELLAECLRERPDDRLHDLRMAADRLRASHEELTGRPYPRSEPIAAEALADALNNRAVSLLDLGKPEAAEQHWARALQADPVHPEATYNLGLLRWRRGEWTDDAYLAVLQDITASSADNLLFPASVAQVHLERGDAGSAVRLLGQVPSNVGDRAGVPAQLARARERVAASRRPVGTLADSAEAHTIALNRSGTHALVLFRGSVARWYTIDDGEANEATE